MKPQPIGSTRQLIAKLAGISTAGVFTLDDAVRLLRVPRRTASRRLGEMARAGWTTRLRRGVFALRPLESPPEAAIVHDDPWVIAAFAFPPCYIGGWTAAQHWGLTEQLFKTTFVVTHRRLRGTRAVLGGNRFHVVRDSRAWSAGVAPLWRGSARVPVSTVERTLVDGCAAPSWLGGGRALAEAFAVAVRDGLLSEERVLAVARAYGRGVAMARLGLLTERYWPHAMTLLLYARDHRGAGIVNFAPGSPARGRILRRWGVRLNTSLGDDLR